MTEKSKKMVSRSIALALGVIVIVLAAGVVAVFAYYQPALNTANDNNSDLTTENQAQAAQITYLNSQLSTAQNQNSNSTAQIGNLTTQVTQLTTWLNGNVSLLNSLNVTAEELNSTLTAELTALAQVGMGLNVTSGILTLNTNDTTLQTTVWVDAQTINNAANAYTNVDTFTAAHAGYIVLNCTSSKPHTYARFIYTANGVEIDSGEIVVGQNGVAVFPVLPADVQVIVGNHAANAGASGVTETITVTYYY
jgi:Tfp pilus assembly protein PilN